MAERLPEHNPGAARTADNAAPLRWRAAK